MKTLYTTGRNYGTPQVLEITAPDNLTNDLQLVEVHFSDDARGISGTVEILDIQAKPERIGREVLAEYDAGNYKIVSHSNNA
jgi:hypothetical protein